MLIKQCLVLLKHSLVLALQLPFLRGLELWAVLAGVAVILAVLARAWLDLAMHRPTTVPQECRYIVHDHARPYPLVIATLR